jgi:hypothetical protein
VPFTAADWNEERQIALRQIMRLESRTVDSTALYTGSLSTTIGASQWVGSAAWQACATMPASPKLGRRSSDSRLSLAKSGSRFAPYDPLGGSNATGPLSDWLAALLSHL